MRLVAWKPPNNHNRKSKGQQVSNTRRVGHPRGTVCKPCRRTRLDLGEKRACCPYAVSETLLGGNVMAYILVQVRYYKIINY